MIIYSFCSLNLKSLFSYNTVYSTYTFVFIAADNLTNHQACIVIVWCSFSFATSVQLFYLFILFLISFFLCSGIAAMQILFIFGSMVILQCML